MNICLSRSFFCHPPNAESYRQVNAHYERARVLPAGSAHGPARSLGCNAVDGQRGAEVLTRLAKQRGPWDDEALAVAVRLLRAALRAEPSGLSLFARVSNSTVQ